MDLIKTVKAKTYPEAVNIARQQYGDEAFVVNQKTVKEGGLFKSKYFAKTMVEVTVQIPQPKKSDKGVKGMNADITLGSKQENMAKLLKVIEATRNMEPRKPFERDLTTSGKYEDTKAVVDFFNGSSGSRTEFNAGVSSAVINKLEKDIAEIKERFSNFISQQTAQRNESVLSNDSELAFLKKYAEILKKNDFDEQEREKILRAVRNSVSQDDVNDEYKIEKSFKDLLKSKVVTSGPIKTGNKKKIVMFIGPTGVGKTTTLAKIGARYALNEGKRVVFITLDNYRIAATEQLKKYAEIIKLPIFAINDQKEFRAVIERENADVVLVDTAGRSYRNQMKISEVKSFADVIDYDLEKVLCVSANTRKNDVDEVFDAFGLINFDSVIITKVDEASNVGNIVDIADKYNKPISYLTNGQEVPTDILVADPDKLVDLMVGNFNG